MSSDKDTRDIISYLNRTLPIYRLKDFEERLARDLPFREKYEMQRKLHEVFEAMQLDEIKKKEQEATRLANQDLVDMVRATLPDTPLPEKEEYLETAVIPLWKKPYFHWAVAAAVILVVVGITLYRSGNENDLPHHITDVDDNKGKTDTVESIIHENLLDKENKEYANTPSVPEPLPKPALPQHQTENNGAEDAIAEKKDPENDNQPTDNLPDSKQSPAKTFLISFRQSNRTGGVGALPDGNTNTPAFIQDSVQWKLDIHRLENTDFGRRTVGHYELDRSGRHLNLHLNERGYSLIENASQITLERQSDSKLTVYSGSRPLLLLFGNGSVEVAL